MAFLLLLFISLGLPFILFNLFIFLPSPLPLYFLSLLLLLFISFSLSSSLPLRGRGPGGTAAGGGAALREGSPLGGSPRTPVGIALHARRRACTPTHTDTHARSHASVHAGALAPASRHLPARASPAHQARSLPTHPSPLGHAPTRPPAVPCPGHPQLGTRTAPRPLFLAATSPSLRPTLALPSRPRGIPRAPTRVQLPPLQSPAAAGSPGRRRQPLRRRPVGPHRAELFVVLKRCLPARQRRGAPKAPVGGRCCLLPSTSHPGHRVFLGEGDCRKTAGSGFRREKPWGSLMPCSAR